MTDHFVVTGGTGASYTLATKYNLAGWLEDLPALNKGRQNHGCAWFRADGGTLVYLVTGGWARQRQEPRSSTEMLTSGSAHWSITSPLPYSISGLRAATIDNIPFFFGKLSLLFLALISIPCFRRSKRGKRISDEYFQIRPGK